LDATWLYITCSSEQDQDLALTASSLVLLADYSQQEEKRNDDEKKKIPSLTKALGPVGTELAF